MSLPVLNEVARSIQSPLFQGARSLFVAQHGLFKYVTPGTGAFYKRDETGLTAGVIEVGTAYLNAMIRNIGNMAAPAILVHEMGHFMYAKQNFATQRLLNRSVAAVADWCLMREAQAALFGYRVAKELKAKGLPMAVLAPPPDYDIFDRMAAAERTGANLLTLAKAVYAADNTVVRYCRGETDWTGFRAEDIPTIRIIGKRRSGSAAGRR